MCAVLMSAVSQTDYAPVAPPARAESRGAAIGGAVEGTTTGDPPAVLRPHILLKALWQQLLTTP